MFAADFLQEMVLPFILVFVLVFAILEKSKLLGGEKHQINALISLCVGLLLMGFSKPRELLITIVPWLAVGLAVLFVFFILYGFINGDLSANTGLPGKLKIALGILVGLFVIGVVFFTTGLNKIITGWFRSGTGLIGNILIVLVVVGLIIWVISSGGSSGADSKKK